MLIIGLILFWIVVFGFVFLLKEKFAITFELTLPIIFTIISLIMFFAGILNIMLLSEIIVTLMGIICFVYFLHQKKWNLKKLIDFDINFLLIFIIFVYITIITSGLHLTHYDNFSHWGLIVKSMFLNNSFPNFENDIILFKGYQPGSACFIYYLGFLLGKTESSMILAQNYLLVAYFFSLFALIKNKKDILLRLLIIVSFLFVMFGNIVLNDLLVDTLLSVVSVCSFVTLYYYRNNIKKAFLYVLPLSIFLLLIKNIGLFFAGFNCIGLLYLGIYNKKIKLSILYSIIIMFLTVLVFYIWYKHVSFVYGAEALNSKHTLSMSQILREYNNKNNIEIAKFWNMYFSHFIEIAKNIPNIFMLGLNAIYIILLILYKKMRSNIAKIFLFSNFIYIIYFLILGIMYILSMPINELKYLAEFDRYMLTIILLIIGLLIICIIHIVNKNELRLKNSSVLIMLISIILIINFKFMITDKKLLIGIQNYKDTIGYKFDKNLNSAVYYANKNDYYYIYAPKSSVNDRGYIYYLSKYKLFTSNYQVVNNINAINTNLTNSNVKIIVIDEDKTILNFLKDNQIDKNGVLKTVKNN